MTDITKERYEKLYKAINPKKGEIKFCRPIAKCSPGLLDPKSGCGHIITPFYMSPGTLNQMRAGKVPLPWFALCGVCGRQFIFAFWKLNSLPDYKPSEAVEKDIRALYADFKRMAQGKDPEYQLEPEEAMKIHCHRCASGLPCSGKGAPIPLEEE